MDADAKEMMRDTEPAACYQSRRVWLRCRTCGARPGVLHIPTHYIGYFCGKCCPACRLKLVAKE
jgi:hypothetical protein